MLLASKYEEMYQIELRDLVWIADDAYTRADIISMELKMLNALEFNLGTPLPIHFLRRYSKASEATTEIHQMSKFLTELSFNSYTMAGFLPSEIAAASLSISRTMAGDFHWVSFTYTRIYA